MCCSPTLSGDAPICCQFALICCQFGHSHHPFYVVLAAVVITVVAHASTSAFFVSLHCQIMSQFTRRVVATRMQSNKDRQQDHTLVPADKPPKTVGPLAIAQEIFEHDGITVWSHQILDQFPYFDCSGQHGCSACIVCSTEPVHVLGCVNALAVPDDDSEANHAHWVVRPVLQGFWKGVLPSLVMVCNPTVQYVLFEWLLARVRDARVKAGRKGSAIAPTGGQVCFIYLS